MFSSSSLFDQNAEVKEDLLKLLERLFVERTLSPTDDVYNYPEQVGNFVAFARDYLAKNRPKTAFFQSNFNCVLTLTDGTTVAIAPIDVSDRSGLLEPSQSVRVTGV